MAKLIEITGKAISGEWGSDDNDGNGIPVLRTANFTNEGCVDFSNVVTRSIKNKTIKDKLLRYGDIIIEKSGGSDKQPVGRVVFFEGEENKYLFNNFTGLLRVRNTTKWLPKYVFYALFANYINGATLKFENRTTGLHNLQTDNYIAATDIPECSIDGQIEIVQKFDHISKMISVMKEQLEALDQLVKSRFIEMFGDRWVNDKRWKKKRLGESAEFYNGKAHEQIVDGDGEFILVTSRCIASDLLDYRKTNVQLFPLLVGDICMVMSDVPNGKALAKCMLIDKDNLYTLNQRICCFRNYDFNPIFFFYLLNRHEYLLAFNDGDSQTNLRKDDLLACPIICPPIKLQEEFAAFVQATDKSKLAIQQSLDELETLKKSLMQKYFG